LCETASGGRSRRKKRLHVLGRNRLSASKPGNTVTGVPFMSVRRYVLAKNAEVRNALHSCETFASWAKQNNYDAIVFPLAAFASRNTRRKLEKLRQLVLKHGIALEAGGWDLSSLVPRRYFLFHRESFRMADGKRLSDHHFCPTSPGAIRILNKTGEKLFKSAAGIEVFHLWPDKGAESVWCSCPTCRAFTFQEQNRMGVNAAADVLAAINPGASVTFLEKQGEESKIPLRKNVSRLDDPFEEKAAT